MRLLSSSLSFWLDLWFCRERSIEIVVVIPLLKMSSKELFSHSKVRILTTRGPEVAFDRSS